MNDETWADIPGYGGKYQISPAGDVRSRAVPGTRSDGRRLNYRPGPVQVHTHQYGYPVVRLSWMRKARTHYLHRLLAEAFIPNHNGYPEVRHLNDDKFDFRLENLAWGTHAENMADIVRNGLHWQSNKTVCVRGHELTQQATRRKCYVCHSLPTECPQCGQEVARSNMARHRKKEHEFQEQA